jgi:lysozyme
MYTNGIDVSEWQGAVNFQKAKNNGADFSFIRAQFGLNQDNRFIANWNNAKDAGLLRGAYMFPITSVSSSLQIIKFAGILDKDPGELPPVLDIEPYQDSIPNKQTILEYVNFILDEFGVYPIIYTGYYAWRDKVRSTDDIFAKCPLWIANYDVSKPIIPAPLKEWTFWLALHHWRWYRYGSVKFEYRYEPFQWIFP